MVGATPELSLATGRGNVMRACGFPISLFATTSFGQLMDGGATSRKKRGLLVLTNGPLYTNVVGEEECIAGSSGLNFNPRTYKGRVGHATPYFFIATKSNFCPYVEVTSSH